jgi:hypothetical protein
MMLALALESAIMGWRDSLLFGLKHVRCLAILSCLCFLASVCDNIPDCPELLSQNTAAMMCAQSAASHNPAVLPNIPLAFNIAPIPFSGPDESVRDLLAPLSSSLVVEALFHAANTSPPLV